MVKWKFWIEFRHFGTWTEFWSISASLNEFGIQFINALLSPKSVDGFLLASLMTPLPIHFTHFTLLEGNLRKWLRGGRCRQVLGFAHLLHATFGRPLNSIKNASNIRQTSKSWQVSAESADLPVTSVTVGRHLERRRALCRCSSRSRWSRGRRKAPFPQGEAGRRMAPCWCRCLPRHRIKHQHISCHSKSYIEHCNKNATILSLAHVVVQHEQIICNSFDCKIIRLSLLCHQPLAGGSREPALFLVSPQVVTYCCFGIIFSVKINRNQVRYKWDEMKSKSNWWNEKCLNFSDGQWEFSSWSSSA